MKKKPIFLLAVAVVIVLCIAFFHPIVRWNNHKLQSSITSLETGTVNWNDVVPFTWEAVYTFDPYTSVAEIEKTIGFSSRSIQETVSEGMVQLLFVKDKRVVASVCGYSDQLGYSVDFEGKILFEENARFTVTNEGGIVELKKQ